MKEIIIASVYRSYTDTEGNQIQGFFYLRGVRDNKGMFTNDITEARTYAYQYQVEEDIDKMPGRIIFRTEVLKEKFQ